MDLSTRHLRSFLAVADLLNFTKAAKQINTSQPALSATINQLEWLVGGKLFDRDGRSVSLTPLGATFENNSRRLLKDFERTAETLRDHVERRIGRVDFASIPSASGFLAAPVVAKFLRKNTGIRFAILDLMNIKVIESVQNGISDLGIAIPDGTHRELEWRPLWNDPFVVVLPKDHPLAACDKVRWQDLVQNEIIFSDRASIVRRLTLQHLGGDTFNEPDTRLEAQLSSTAVAMVQHGIGITIQTEMTIRMFSGIADLAVRQMTNPPVFREIALVRRKGRSLSPAAQALWDMFQETL